MIREWTDYSPGGLSGKSLARSKAKARSKHARRAGLASGRRRRQLAHARRGHAGRGPVLALSYELRQPSRSEFLKRYAKAFPPPETPQGAAQWERGRETVWQHLLSAWRLVAAQGQHCRTTKPQRARALEKRDRGRCERTVRRLNVKLEQLGYAAFSHWRAPKGRKDCLVLEWHLSRRLPALDVTPPSGTVNPGLRPGGSPPYREDSAASRQENDPAYAGERPPPSAAGLPDEESHVELSEEELEAARKFAARGHSWAQEILDRQTSPETESARARREGSACEGRPR